MTSSFLRWFVRFFGLTLLVASGIFLFGWYVLDWRFVDPFLAALVFISAPFFAVMGSSSLTPIPNQEEIENVIPDSNEIGLAG